MQEDLKSIVKEAIEPKLQDQWALLRVLRRAVRLVMKK